MQTFTKFDNYNWQDDTTFQQGITSIVEKYGNDSEAVENAKFWYFSKYVEPINPQEYKEWKQNPTSIPSNPPDHLHPPAIPTDDTPKYPKSFFELCDMLAKGIPIPGIRQIPDKLAEGEPSQATLEPPKKPWET